MLQNTYTRFLLFLKWHIKKNVENVIKVQNDYDASLQCAL